MKTILIKLIVRIGLRDKKRLLRLLAKLEYGVAIFCFKLADKAKKEKHENLATLLKEHGDSEVKHGKMLASLADKGNRITLTEETGRWTSVTRISTGQQLARPNPELTAQGKEISWDSINFPGERLQGTFENFDGLSKRYLSLRLFFRNKSAYEYPWNDKLALMHILEQSTREFYQAISKQSNDTTIQAIATQIATDEDNHAHYLYQSLKWFSYFPDHDIQKWQSRFHLAIWGLVIDAWRFLD